MSSISYQAFLVKINIKWLILFPLFFIFQEPLFSQALPKKKAFTLVIDPGHGGKDPGTVWKKVYEKDIALAIALKFGDYIKKNLPEVKVIFTRETDVFIDLDKRAPIANKNQADLFISIHVNSNEKSTSADGTETFFMGTAKSEENLEVAKKENAVILLEDDYSTKYQGYDPKSPNSFIIFSLLQNTHWKQSLHFADFVQSQFAEQAKRPSRGVKQAGFLVLWRTAMPSVLIETGFISNEEERKFLTSVHGQDVMAKAIFRAFKNYKESIESRSISVSSGNIHNIDSLPIAPKQNLTSSPQSDSLTVNVPDDNNGSAESDTSMSVGFLVQVASSKKQIEINSQYFKDLKDIEEFKTGDSYKYAVGRKSSYKEIVEYSKIVKNYFPDAFIIAVKDGKIIPVKDALKEIKN